MPRQLSGFVAYSVALLIGSATAWAGRGDIDPTFGVGGRMVAADSVVSLPEDQFMSCDPADRAFLVRRFDADGHLDPTFGDGGEIVVPLPSGETLSMGGCRLVDARSGLLFAAYLRDAGLNQILEVVLRVDGSGKLDTSFGKRRDGVYRLTDSPVQVNGGFTEALASITVDASGRILFAERRDCGGPANNVRESVVRLTPNGEPDATFGTDGRADLPVVVDMCTGAVLLGVRDDGSVVVAGRGIIEGFDVNGKSDVTFGVNGIQTDGVPDSDGWRGRLLADGGILIIGNRRENASADSQLRKFDRHGRLDSTFGDGTGVVSLALGAAFAGDAGARVSAGNFVLDPDGSHLYVQLSVLNGDDTTACNSGIARLAMDGTPDAGFGKQGLTCLDYGAFPFWLEAAQDNGAPLFRGVSAYGSSQFRLLVDAKQSPGMLTLVEGSPSRVSVVESAGSATMTVARVAGRDGPVGARYGTGYPPFDDALHPDGPGDGTALATAGTDYQPVSGLLEWTDGDDEWRTVSVSILDDTVHENRAIFGLLLSDPTGGVLVNGGSTNVEIVDDDPPAPPVNPPTANPPPSGGGGGGSLSWVTLLTMLGLAACRRGRRVPNLRDRPA